MEIPFKDMMPNIKINYKMYLMKNMKGILILILINLDL